MPTVMWHDGHLDDAPTWSVLEDRLRAEQPHRYGRVAFRLEMRHRARVWSATTIRVLGTSERFFHDLERAGMLRIVTEEVEA